jgi:hypothetical protein
VTSDGPRKQPGRTITKDDLLRHVVSYLLGGNAQLSLSWEHITEGTEIGRSTAARKMGDAAQPASLESVRREVEVYLFKNDLMSRTRGVTREQLEWMLERFRAGLHNWEEDVRSAAETVFLAALGTGTINHDRAHVGQFESRAFTMRARMFVWSQHANPVVKGNLLNQTDGKTFLAYRALFQEVFEAYGRDNKAETAINVMTAVGALEDGLILRAAIESSSEDDDRKWAGRFAESAFALFDALAPKRQEGPHL